MNSNKAIILEIIMSLILYGASLSLYVRKIRYILEHKKLNYVQEQGMPSQEAQFLVKSPLGKIPYLQDQDKIINDSSVICFYLEKKHPEHSVLPNDDYLFARSLWFEEYSDTKVTELITGIYFEEVAKPLFFKDIPDPEVIAAKKAALPAVFDYLESQLNDSFIAGPEVSLGDYALASNFVNYDRLGLSINITEWPKLHSYVQRLLSLETVVRVSTAEDAEMSQ